jgi:hypothetical protein
MLSPLVTTPEQCTLISLLNKKAIKDKRIKGMNGLEKICIQDKCGSPSTKAPTGKALHPLLSLHPLAWTSLYHIIHLHGSDEVSSGNFPLPVDTSPIGCPVIFSKLVLQACVMSLSF